MQYVFFLKNKVLYGMGMRYRYVLRTEKYSFIQKMEIRLLGVIGRIYSGKTPDRIIKKWFEIVDDYNASVTGWRLSVNSPLVKMYMKPLPEEWYESFEYGIIRGKKFPIIKGWQNKLKAVYGDYMRPDHDPSKYISHLDEKQK